MLFKGKHDTAGYRQSAAGKSATRTPRHDGYFVIVAVFEDFAYIFFASREYNSRRLVSVFCGIVAVGY